MDELDKRISWLHLTHIHAYTHTFINTYTPGLTGQTQPITFGEASWTGLLNSSFMQWDSEFLDILV